MQYKLCNTTVAWCMKYLVPRHQFVRLDIKVSDIIWTITIHDKNKINKLIKKAGSVIDLSPDSLEVTVGKRMGTKLKTVLILKVISCTLYSMASKAHLVSGY